MNRTNDNILDHDDDALLSEKHIRPFEFLKKLSESDSIRTCLVTANKNHTHILEQQQMMHRLRVCLMDAIEKL